ncbi:hypothetical protein PHMEG_0008584 [Phytophthora megakarya]|uniref:Uncharacterized protein n=1 Tax=Phytophthora megakarya TaxID=4795 RepID=A0A225WIC0_9STRA|nr:hypothetical protein PHMEG_0008584 [Phytophthora megakarya]
MTLVDWGFLSKTIGTFTEKDLATMNEWHDLTPKFDAFIETRFGQVGIEKMSYFRRSEWLDDSCMKLAISHIMDQDQDGHGKSRIGGVNPLFARVFDDATKL